MDRKTTQKFVLNGAEFLDRTQPGWRGRIRQGFDIGNEHSCILAQLTGQPYSEAKKTCAVPNTVEMGFYVSGSNQTAPEVREQYDLLNEEWTFLTQVAAMGCSDLISTY